MFDGEVLLTAEEYDAFVIACLETQFDQEYPDPADWVRDERQRFFDSRARLLTRGAAHLDDAVAAERRLARDEAARAESLAAFARSRPAAVFDRAPGERGAASAASIAARPAALTEVSEWAVDEAAATLAISGRAASLLLADAVTLVEALPLTHAALSAGEISPAHARAMVEIAGRVADPDKRRAVEEAVLPRAPRQTPPALRASVRRAVARIDAAAAAERLVAAVRERQVRLSAADDGMSVLTAMLATPVARACSEALGAYAKACEYDDEGNRDARTHQERMADCFADLILRPHGDHPAVQVVLTLVAGVDTMTGRGPGADEPGELEGDLVPAVQVRELAREFGLMPRPTGADAEPLGATHLDATHLDAITPAGAPEMVAATAPAVPTETIEAGVPADATSTAGGTTIVEARDATELVPSPPADAAPRQGEVELACDAELAALRDAEHAAADDLRTALAAGRSGAASTGTGTDGPTWAALTRLLDTRRLIDTALAERPRIAVVDQLSGTLLALTDSTELRRAAATGRGLGPPVGTDAYRPTEPLHRFVQLRDRRCRFPGCRVRARCSDLDHQIPHPHGETAHDNLACLCEHHHRLSHQAPGWRLHRAPDGGLVWTLPSGRRITTYPPAFGGDDGEIRVQPPHGKPGGERYEETLDALRSTRELPGVADAPF